ncbi:MAG: hypothetical protein KJP21_00865, partial [Bacteroidia bacterium]|nr:hypothetical protein [Bacteroidia bacterium]
MLHKFFICVGFTFFISCNSYDWGHHFTFTNNTGYEVDSLKISIGNEENVLHSDTENEILGNLSVPNSGYPHPVSIILFSNGKKIKIHADSFNCYQCDGSHEYI